jgi:hypothetical protein
MDKEPREKNLNHGNHGVTRKWSSYSKPKRLRLLF